MHHNIDFYDGTEVIVLVIIILHRHWLYIRLCGMLLYYSIYHYLPQRNKQNHTLSKSFMSLMADWAKS